MVLFVLVSGVGCASDPEATITIETGTCVRDAASPSGYHLSATAEVVAPEADAEFDWDRPGEVSCGGWEHTLIERCIHRANHTDSVMITLSSDGLYLNAGTVTVQGLLDSPTAPTISVTHTVTCPN